MVGRLERMICQREPEIRGRAVNRFGGCYHNSFANSSTLRPASANMERKVLGASSRR